jgi:SH3 domain protein
MKSLLKIVTTITTTVLLLLSFSHVSAETAYIIDNIRVGLRDAPEGNADKIIVMDSGTRLEIIGSKNGYNQVKTESGREGWVSAVYLQNEPTAALQLQLKEVEFNQQLQILKEELDKFQDQNEQIQNLNLKLEGIISQLREDNHNLTLEMDDIKSKGIFTSEYRLPIILVTFVLFILVGFIAGYSLYHQKVTKRFGGLNV